MRDSSPEMLRVGLVQMACEPGDVEANLSRAEALLRELDGAVQIACLPELFSTGYSLELLGHHFARLAEPIPGPTSQRLGELAGELEMAILGTIVERSDGRLHDTTFHLDRRGRLVGRYRKSHLFPPERRYFVPGNELPTFQLDGFPVATAICFEHAFPQIFTAYALAGARVVFIPSAVPTGYEYLLRLRTRARAQDNQFFVAAVNRVGGEGDVHYCGLSQIVDPRGRVLAEAPPDREVALTAELDLGRIEAERRQEPVLESLRPELYGY